jgi:hypothetical protein
LKSSCKSSECLTASLFIALSSNDSPLHLEEVTFSSLTYSLSLSLTLPPSLSIPLSLFTLSQFSQWLVTVLKRDPSSRNRIIVILDQVAQMLVSHSKTTTNCSSLFYDNGSLSNLHKTLRQLLTEEIDSLCYDCLSISFQSIDILMKEFSSSALRHRPRYLNLHTTSSVSASSTLIYSQEVMSKVLQVISLQRSSSSSLQSTDQSTTEQFVAMIRRFRKKDGLHLFTAEHMVNILSLLSPSFSPLAVTSRALLSLYATQPLSSYITSTPSEYRELFSDKKKFHRGHHSSSDTQQQRYFSVSMTKDGDASFFFHDLMTCALVPTFLSAHEQTPGNLVSLSSFCPSFPHELSILVLPPNLCLLVSSLRLELLLCLPNSSEEEPTAPIPNLVSRTVMCLHGLVSRCSLPRHRHYLQHEHHETLCGVFDLAIDEDCLATVQTHHHTILLPVIESSLCCYLKTLLSALHQDSPSPDLLPMSPLVDLLLKYVTVCLSLLERCVAPQDASYAIIELFVFERQLILCFISSALSHQSQGKVISLSILLRCLSILLFNLDYLDPDPLLVRREEEMKVEENTQSLHLIAVSLLVSLLDLYWCDERHCSASEPPYPATLVTQWRELTLRGKQFISQKSSSLIFSRSSLPCHRLDLERVVYGGQECVDHHQSTASAQLCWGSSSQLHLQVEFLFPSSVNSHKKKKYCHSLEKMSVQWTHCPPLMPTSTCSFTESNCHLSPDFVLIGFLSRERSKYSDGNTISLSPGDLHGLVQYFARVLSLYRQSPLFNDWFVPFLSLIFD